MWDGSVGVCAQTFLVVAMKNPSILPPKTFPKMQIIIVFIVSILIVSCSTNDSKERRENPLPKHPNTISDSISVLRSWQNRFLNKPYTVLITFSTECPISKSYVSDIQQFVQQSNPDSFAFCVLIPNVSSRNMAVFKDIEFRDTSLAVCNTFGFTVYPECVVLSKKKKVIYRGCIDDRPVDVGVIYPHATKKFLAQVIMDIQHNTNISVPSNKAIGCFIGKE